MIFSIKRSVSALLSSLSYIVDMDNKSLATSDILMRYQVTWEMKTGQYHIQE